MYQVRFDGGAIQDYDSLVEALDHNGGDWDKVSWTVGEGRLILRKVGKQSWELWTPESLLRSAEE